MTSCPLSPKYYRAINYPKMHHLQSSALPFGHRQTVSNPCAYRSLLLLITTFTLLLLSSTILYHTTYKFLFCPTHSLHVCLPSLRHPLWPLQTLYAHTHYSCVFPLYSTLSGPYKPSTHTLTTRVSSLPTAPSLAPTNFTCHPVGSDGMNLRWVPPPRESFNGVLRHYQISILELETSRRFFEYLLGSRGFVGSLHPFYSYTVNMAAVTVAPGPYSNNVTITTLQDGEIKSETFIFLSLVYSPV